MNFLLLCAMAFSFTLFTVLFQRLGRNSDNKRRRMELISAKGKKILDDDIEAPFFKRFLQPA